MGEMTQWVGDPAQRPYRPEPFSAESAKPTGEPAPDFARILQPSKA